MKIVGLGHKPITHLMVIIMLTIPFGLAGALIGHVFYGYVMNQDMPITFMSMMGMVALTGIVVNDSIVLIVAVNDRVRGGIPFLTALQEAGVRRFRAILLTTMTTFIGLFPLLLERSFQAQVLIPMAVSVAAGVVFGTCATLVIIPCMLCILNDVRRIFYLARHLEWPSREHVEMAELLQMETAGNEE
jgi:multidrug efflux pump subunit AcrB